MTTNTTWSTNNLPNGGIYTIAEQLVVESGVTLTIDSGVVIQFFPGAELIVEPNAELVLHGTLTSIDGFTWSGVRVWGSTTATTQAPDGNGDVAQGVLRCEPGSIIEHADAAVQLWGPTEAHSGGQIYARRAKFRNNGWAVRCMPFQNNWGGQPRNYASRFIETEFKTDENMRPCVDFIGFIDMIGVNGINIKGCVFDNQLIMSTIEAHGYGIRANNSGFHLGGYCEGPSQAPAQCTSWVRSSFSGLGYAVFACQMPMKGTGMPRPYRITRTDFVSNYCGVYSGSVSAATIMFCDFNMGTLPNTQIVDQQIGVMFEGPTSGITFQENSFWDTIGGVSTVGTVCKDLGDSDVNIVRRNSYEGLDRSIQAEGTNASLQIHKLGLTFQCNSNTSTINYDIWVTGDNLDSAVVKKDQGTPIIPAGNKFSASGEASIVNEGLEINYYYYNTSNEVPHNSYGIAASPSSGINLCVPVECEEPCLSTFEIDSLKTAYDNHLVQFNYHNNSQSSDSALYYHGLMQDHVYRIIYNGIADTIGFDMDTIMEWLRNNMTYGSDYWLAVVQAGLGEYNDALSTIQNIPSNYTLTDSQTEAIDSLLSILELLEYEEVFDLSDSAMAILIDMKGGGAYSDLVVNQVLSLNDIWYWPTVQTSPGSRMNSFVSAEYQQDDGNRIAVFPNPAGERLHVVCGLTKEKVHIKLHSMFGEELRVPVVANGGGYFVIDCSELPPGTYHMTVFDEATGFISTKKIVVI